MLKKTLNSIRAFYSPQFPKTITYMLQTTEYRVGPYLKWFWRTDDFSKVRSRKDLDKTVVAKLILNTLQAGVVIEIIGGLVLIFLTINEVVPGGWAFGMAAIIAYPVVWSQLICLPVSIARLAIIDPKERKAAEDTKKVLKKHKGIKIAVAGSYGKTTMKELLLTVLSSGKKVAATPANKNVVMSHQEFAKNLSGKEDIVIVEFGEGGPGDVNRFAQTIRPDLAVITGIAPAHLDRYKTVSAAAKDIFSLSNYLDSSKVYVNGESLEAVKYLQKGMNTYDHNGALGWQVQDVSLSIRGLKFKLIKAKKVLNLSSPLIGRHQLGPLALVAALAIDLGLTDKQVEEGIESSKPYEHRMQPYELNDGWIIDDTYNGNLEGIRAGTVLLKELKADRKIYVTPGLVDQGKETARVHKEVGRLIAEAEPDKVVLFKNSVTGYIQAGLNKAKYRGQVDVENDPLFFYNNLRSFIAAGDIVLMQNDWTDNYL